jgi:hypothetical protein
LCRKLRETALQELNSFFQLIVASTVLAATELTISWNGIQNVNDVNSAAQTIPMIVTLGLVLRVIYIALLGDLDERYTIRMGPTNMSFLPPLHRVPSFVSGYSTEPEPAPAEA